MFKQKYRIVEFQLPVKDDNKFYIDLGQTVWKKVFGFIYWPHTIWNVDKNEHDQAIGHKTYNEAIARIEDIKSTIPIYHEIR